MRSRDGLASMMISIAGRLVSEIIIDAKPSLDLNALRFSRFKEGINRKSAQVV